ncbi:ABC transporter ATP-binding protein [Streptomyces shenzhenensis]|uniref:ABC transporter ATP-binding protein n=2 Tax=Streptomyces shenzhenensis TaxID=943815 RepID=A0A3M0I0S7_9ACTN|nr:ABC transporter ATP-binding protein [Streptomyces shenzhenensis]
MILLLGPSGCGKSTLLLALSGLIPASIDAELRGTILCAGIDTQTVKAGQLATHVGVVLQDPDAQVVTGTLLDEVCFGLENLLAPTEDIEPRALAALRQVGLAETREQALRPPTELSGGGRQRLAIACALALDPSVLLLDEPTANLDPAASAEFYSTLAALSGRSRTVVLIEHELDDALELADRVVVLSRTGTVTHDGTPAEVFGQHGRELLERGVWLPIATQMALRLGLDSDPNRALPLTAAELDSILDETPPQLHVVERDRPQGGLDDATAAIHINVSGARVALGGAEVLHGIDLSIAVGEFLAIAGVNGAGKSTLTRAIAGLVPLRSGTIDLDGIPVADMHAHRLGEQVGYVFQNPEHQFLARTVREEIGYGLRVRSRPDAEITERVEAMLDRFDLRRYADLNPFLLSHGEKRRLSVATALITEPRILILDEPTFGQDHERATEIIRVVDELGATGITILMVTHDMQLIADHAHRIVVLADGALLREGPTADVLRDEALIERAGLRMPPVHRIARRLAQRRPEWSAVYRSEQIEAISS